MSRPTDTQQTLAVQLVRLVVRINPRTLREQRLSVAEPALLEQPTRLTIDRPTEVISIIHARAAGPTPLLLRREPAWRLVASCCVSAGANQEARRSASGLEVCP